MHGHRVNRRPSTGSWLNGLFDSGIPKSKLKPLRYLQQPTEPLKVSRTSKQCFTNKQRRKQVSQKKKTKNIGFFLRRLNYSQKRIGLERQKRHENHSWKKISVFFIHFL